MARLLGIFAIAAFSATFLASCGLDCEEYCDKMKDCNQGRCDTGRCEDLCSDALDAGSGFGWEDQAQCAIDSSCSAIDDGACFDGNRGIAWCGD